MANSNADERTNTKAQNVAKSFTNIVFIKESRYKNIYIYIYIYILWFSLYKIQRKAERTCSY